MWRGPVAAGGMTAGEGEGMDLGSGEHVKFISSIADAKRLAETWLHFRITLELFVAAGISLLDAMDGDGDAESDGTENEDDEGQYSIPGQLYLCGAIEDDEQDDN